MPTGYTCDIGKGISFKQFALNCARAFGACIEMREEPFDKPIPEKFELTNYYLQKRENDEEEIKKIKSLSIKECNQLSVKDYEKQLKSYNEIIKERANLKKKYEAMLNEANKYIPPSKDHIEFKNFMISQITDSIKFDCSISYIDKPILLTGKEWKEQQLKKLQWSLDYNIKGNEEEVKRVNGRNKWIKELRDSLK